jgi:site-specific recombinase XerD
MYFMDFQAMYPVPAERSDQVRLFSEKLRSIGQSDSPNALPRTCLATHLLQANYDIRTIQTLLGHSDVRTTMICTHCVPSRTLKELKSPLDF